jgi:D-alanyl-D-alanine dipeptidase
MAPMLLRRLPALALVISLGVTAAAQDRPPSDPKAARKADLVELVTLDPTIKLDIRYARSNNFLGKPVYPEARAFLQRPAADALLRAHRALAPHGYGLLIHDGYRPWRITKLFWDMTAGTPMQEFVADPKSGSKHNRGCAVDLTMYEFATGDAVQMPGEYDEPSLRSYPGYKGGPPEARAKRDLLRAVMEAQGFTVEPNEWWHFNYKDWTEYPILDIPFTEAAKR